MKNTRDNRFMLNYFNVVYAWYPTSTVTLGDDSCSTKMTASFSSNSEFYIGGITNANSLIMGDSTLTSCDSSGKNGFLYKYGNAGEETLSKLIPRQSETDVVEEIIAI